MVSTEADLLGRGQVAKEENLSKDLFPLSVGVRISKGKSAR